MGWSSEPPDITAAPLATASTNEARIISAGIDKMPPERREQALAIMKAAFVEYADYFKEDDNK